MRRPSPGPLPGERGSGNAGVFPGSLGGGDLRAGPKADGPLRARYSAIISIAFGPPDSMSRNGGL